MLGPGRLIRRSGLSLTMARYYRYDGLSPENLELIDCPVCGGQESRFVADDGGFTIVRCATPSCGFVYVNPRPTERQLLDFYADYYDGHAVIPEKWQREMGAIFEECCNAISTRRGSGAVLDVGCSFGHLLMEMERRGWSTTGIEPSPVAASHARAHLAGVVHQSPFENVELDAESFDAVVSLYVLEHVSRPREFVEKVYRVLRPGGLAVIRIPYTAPLFPIQRLLGRPLMYAPMHLNDFSPRSLERLAKSVGFVRVEAHAGRGRRAHDVVENVGARVLGGMGRLVERATGGRAVFPWVGALSYFLEK